MKFELKTEETALSIIIFFIMQCASGRPLDSGVVKDDSDSGYQPKLHCLVANSHPADSEYSNPDGHVPCDGKNPSTVLFFKMSTKVAPETHPWLPFQRFQLLNTLVLLRLVML